MTVGISTGVKLLDRGAVVTALQQALSVAGFSVTEEERSRARFGQTTRTAVVEFQRKSDLEATGIVDEATAAALNRLLDAARKRPPDLDPSHKPFRRMPKLGQSLRAMRDQDDAVKSVIRSSLADELKTLLFLGFEAPSEALVAAIDALEIDLDEVEDMTLHDVVFSKVVPELATDPELERELIRHADRGLDPDRIKVADLLGLNADARESTVLAGLVNRARNEALGDIVEVGDDTIEALGSVNLLADEMALDRLVTDGALTEDQRDDLRATVAFARLTDDNFAAIRALRNDGVRRPRELTSRDRTGWATLITDNQIEPLDGETVESYAALLDAGVERAFPTAYALDRFAGPAPQHTLERLPVLERLGSDVKRVFVDGELSTDLDLADLPESERETIRSDLEDLNKLANRYAALGVRDILNDRSTSPSEKRARIERRTQALARAWEARPDLDLELANFFPLGDKVARGFFVDLEEVDEEDRPHVRAALMSMQRVLGLTDSYAEADRLLSAGLDTAPRIAALADTDQLAERTGLSLGAAMRIMSKALDIRSRVTHVIHALEDAQGHAAFDPAVLKEADTSPDGSLINVLRDIPGYSELFGNQNYCKCRHCRSIFSPAAYFADLMLFIDSNISKPNFVNKNLTDHPLYLGNRRLDLWHIPLTCENTDTPEIYLTIVNEVLAAYLDKVAPLGGDVFDLLASDARSSFKQPFNLPFAELMLYLDHLGVELSAVTSLFDETRTAKPYAVLGISPEEFSTIAAADLGAVAVRYGQTEGFAELDAANLVRRTGVDRPTLTRILDLDFIKANLVIKTEIESATGDLVGFDERIILNRTDGDAVSDFLGRNLLDRLHRFVRLWRSLGWTPEEVQLALDIFTPADVLDDTSGIDSAHTELGEVLNEEVLGQIADLFHLKEQLDFSVSEVLALVSAIPTKPAEAEAESLYARLFGGRLDMTVRHPVLGNTDSDDPFVSPDFGVLQGALRTEETDLIDLMRRRLPEAVIATGILSNDHLATLYRGARLARALRLSQRELAALETIVPGLIDATTLTDRIAALIAATRVVETMEALPLSMGAIADLFMPSTSDAEQRANAAELLAALHGDVISRDRLALTPTDLTVIEPITPDTARVLLAHLADRAEPWVTRPDPETERYLLSAAVGSAPDEEVLVEALTVDDGPLEGVEPSEESVSRAAGALADLFAQRHPVATTIAGIREQFGLSEEFVDAADPLLGHLPALEDLREQLTAWLTTEDAAVPEPLLDHAVALQSLNLLFKDYLSADNVAVGFIAGHQELFAVTPGADWEWESIRRMGAYVARRKASREDADALDFAIAGWNGAGFPADSANDLALVFDAPIAKLSSLLAELPTVGDPFTALARLESGLHLAGRLGLDPVALRQVTSETFAGLTAARDLVHGAMRAKHEREEDWLRVSEPFREKVEGIKRDALVDRILSRDELQFDNAREIYHFFLLDAEMDGCARTSRVKAAISSCQLYVQRCLMGIEREKGGGVVVRVRGEHSRDEWTWRKSYRVWQANREVFLYPENYLLPDLRDDKSHLFEIVEGDLLQSTLDETAIEKIYAEYLTGFASIGSLVVVNCLYDLEERDYIHFGRTHDEPFRYFLRRFDGEKTWTAWQPIDLDIGAKTVTAAKKRGKLYLFWTNVVRNSDADKVTAANEPDTTEEDDNRRESLPVSVIYSVRDGSGKWSEPQDFLFYNLTLGAVPFSSYQYELLEISESIYAEFPHSKTRLADQTNEHRIRVVHGKRRRPFVEQPLQDSEQLHQTVAYLDESRNKLVLHDGTDVPGLVGASVDLPNELHFATSGLQFENREVNAHLVKDDSLLVRNHSAETTHLAGISLHQSLVAADYHQTHIEQLFPQLVSVLRTQRRFPTLFKSIQNRSHSNILHNSDQQFLVLWRNKPGYDKDVAGLELLAAAANSRRKMVRLSTFLPEILAETLSLHGLDRALSLKTQAIPEKSAFVAGLVFDWIGELRPPDEDTQVGGARSYAHFEGANGGYFWETFFHIPFLVAYYLNSLGKFEEADHWYRYIFDPIESSPDTKGPWRFRPFLRLKLPKIRATLTDQAAIGAYKRDPFNPYAIARLRPSAFQKAVVMRYIDNLLDWGDQLFRRDTIESLNEATLLYVMAADILGERPVETGECETTPGQDLSYAAIALLNSGGEFLVELENIVHLYASLDDMAPASRTRADIEFTPLTLLGVEPEEPEEPEEPIGPGSGFAPLAAATASVLPPLSDLRTWRAEVERDDRLAVEAATPLPDLSRADAFTFDPDVVDPVPPTPSVPSADITQNGRRLGFCVPPNETLLGYWDRVEDRLFKIRHCMNIEGVVRELPLWQPRIDPALLVRAKAAGLEIDDVLALINEQPPQHRFEILLDRARQFTATAQQFGSQLLSALERRDESELTLLRSVHEDTILTLAKRQKQYALDEANEARLQLLEAQATIRMRLEHYIRLTTEVTTDAPPGVNKGEANSLAQMESSKKSQDLAGTAESKAQKIREVGPQWSVGGTGTVGIQTENLIPKPMWSLLANASAAYGSSNVEARYQRRAFRHRDAARMHDAASVKASTRAGYARRYEDWVHQRSLAMQELVALGPQFAAADIRIAIAEQELQLHDKQVEQSREVYDFAKDRFSNLGLYTYLSATLSRLHREAYDIAHKMAVSAERAYRFETGDDKFFVENDNWDASRAGLLAADRLLLQLQAMEASFLEKDRRQHEITLRCSLSQIDPNAIVRLRQTGHAEFSLPEWWFDLYYPGQFRRTIQAVRLTIPGVIGPSVNVGARLTLTQSAIRVAPNAGQVALQGVQVGRNASIAASTASSDAGVFELRFDSPRHPPFKGAGAISSWVLDLPKTQRAFDYGTITDVIVELSYTAMDDGAFRATIEAESGANGTVEAMLEAGAVRILSIRRDFPAAFHRLMTTPTTDGGPTTVKLSKRHFPFWLKKRRLGVASIDTVLEPEDGMQIAANDVQNVTATLNGNSSSQWSEAPELALFFNSHGMNDAELDEEDLEVSLTLEGTDTVSIADVLLRIHYTATD